MTAPPPTFRLLVRPGHPDFLDLPWDQPLAEWSHQRLIEVAMGIHRHVVRFVDYEGALYALKELPARLARREYGVLRRMAEEGLGVVECVGTVHRGDERDRHGLSDVLITRYLDYSLPYRIVFAHGRRSPVEMVALSDRLLDGLAVLLVRLHLAGFFWGDCSLSNTLFRRDAGALAAYLVDAETGERHPQLSDGQREHDLAIAHDNVVGGLMDVQVEFDLPPEPDPISAADRLCRRYRDLWVELTREEVIGSNERYRIHQRLRRLNDLGFDVEEVELVAAGDGDRVRMRTSVSDQGHHRRRLTELTGLHAQENQARSLLNDLANFKASEDQRAGAPLPQTVAAHRWLSEVFEPTVAAVPSQLGGKREPAEVFHEVMEHKWYLSEKAGRDVGVPEATESYLRTVLPDTPEERRTLTEEPFIGWE